MNRWLVPVLMMLTAIGALVFSLPISDVENQSKRQGADGSGMGRSAWTEQRQAANEERVRREIEEIEARLEEREEVLRRLALERKKRIKFGADTITKDEENGVLLLEGHAWWRLDNFVLLGQHNPRSEIVLDLETHRVVSSFGAPGSQLIR